MLTHVGNDDISAAGHIRQFADNGFHQQLSLLADPAKNFFLNFFGNFTAKVLDILKPEPPRLGYQFGVLD